jgi:two-component system sensor histidine kinase DesK
MRDRVRALGGTLSIASPAGRGTQVLVRVPLPDNSMRHVVETAAEPLLTPDASA